MARWKVVITYADGASNGRSFGSQEAAEEYAARFRACLIDASVEVVAPARRPIPSRASVHLGATPHGSDDDIMPEYNYLRDFDPDELRRKQQEEDRFRRENLSGLPQLLCRCCGTPVIACTICESCREDYAA